MKRVLVIGCPGGGKSTFACELAKLTDLPLYYLDMLWWNSDKTNVSRELFDMRLGDILAMDEWIIDGNYSRTLDTRLESCDTVFFLDMPLEVCLDGIKKRQGKPRADMPWVEVVQDKEFIQYVKDFSATQRPKILELLKKHGNKNIIVFNTRAEIDNFLIKKRQA